MSHTEHSTHITPERIAALADEPATLVERSHLASCISCTAELVAAQRLVQLALTETPAIERPLTSWAQLAPALRAEGLITTSEAGTLSVATPPRGGDVLPLTPRQVPGQVPGRPGSRYRWMAQAAAGVCLVLGGAAMGRASASMPFGGAATPAVATADTGFHSTAEAVNALQHASDQYQRAVAYIAANDSSVMLRGRDAADLYLARLDAIDRSLAATRSALFRAPSDPVLNNYYIQSVAARNLTLRQLGEVVPVSSTTRTRF